jgi:purine nucleosidase
MNKFLYYNSVNKHDCKNLNLLKYPQSVKQENGMEKHKIILDIDNAHGLPVMDTDDGMALALALTSPEIELLGCTTCAGNCRTSVSTRNTLYMLELADKPNIPVAEGRETPLLISAEASLQYLENRSAGPLSEYYKDAIANPDPEPKLKPSTLKAHQFIIEMVKQYPGEVIIVKEGSFTNLAMALLVEPEIAPLVKEVVHMGGKFSRSSFIDESWLESPNEIPPYIWQNVLLFNTEFDPHATEIVIRSGIPVTFVPGEVTVRVFQRAEHIEMLKKVKTPFHQHLVKWGAPRVDWHIKERKIPGAHMHDPLTLAVIFDRSLCTFVNMRCDLNRFRTGNYPFLLSEAGDYQCTVAVDVNVSRFEHTFSSRLASQIL